MASGLQPASESNMTDPSRGWSLVMLAVATSIDALAVGLSLAMLRITIWQPAVIIGVVTAAFSLTGLRLGARLGKAFSGRMEIVGGFVLFLVAVRILVEHTLV